MKNPRISKRDYYLIKGALRRAFARSDLYKEVQGAYSVQHSDPSRPRCQKWSWCAACGEVVPRWTTALDHVDPVVPLNLTEDEMDIAELVDRIWSHRNNLQLLCPYCHNAKTQAERALRPKRSRKANKKAA